MFIILISTLDFSNFYYMLGGNLGSLLYGDVSVMVSKRFSVATLQCGTKIQILLKLLQSTAMKKGLTVFILTTE